MKRNGISFEVQGELLCVRVHDYHAGPAHLSCDDLAELGLASLQPPPADPGGLVVGDLRFVVAGEGLDVFVLDYHASPLEIAVAELETLGLRWVEPR